MKYICLAFVLFFFSCTKPTLTGHWKCNKTGTVKAMDKNQQIKTAPITELYDLLKLQSLEFVFFEDGSAKSISTEIHGKVSELSFKVYTNHEGYASKYLLRDDTNHDEDIIMTLKSLTKEKMEASFDMVEDDMTMDLKMDRID
ncbi:MAG TPA: hypothetical protein PJ990_05300 [Saprospiraceae bacterium]|nr:hypothetical protein [Saprospiraceae bacterium]